MLRSRQPTVPGCAARQAINKGICDASNTHGARQCQVCEHAARRARLCRASRLALRSPSASAFPHRSPAASARFSRCLFSGPATFATDMTAHTHSHAPPMACTRAASQRRRRIGCRRSGRSSDSASRGSRARSAAPRERVARSNTGGGADSRSWYSRILVMLM